MSSPRRSTKFHTAARAHTRARGGLLWRLRANNEYDCHNCSGRYAGIDCCRGTVSRRDKDCVQDESPWRCDWSKVTKDREAGGRYPGEGMRWAGHAASNLITNRRISGKNLDTCIDYIHARGTGSIFFSVHRGQFPHVLHSTLGFTQTYLVMLHVTLQAERR